MVTYGFLYVCGFPTSDAESLQRTSTFVQLKNEAPWSEVKLRSDIYERGVYESHLGQYFLKSQTDCLFKFLHNCICKYLKFI